MSGGEKTGAVFLILKGERKKPNFPCKMTGQDLVSGNISISSRPSTHE
jgi:hypothetical protein